MVALTRWHLVRHGPLAAPWRGRIIGRTDAGVILPAPLAQPHPYLPAAARWVVSPRRRSQDTARYLGAAPADWWVEPDFAEQDFGAWEERTWHELIATEPHAVSYLEGYDHVRPPGGEHVGDLSARVLAAFTRLSTQHEGEELVAVLHAGPIRCLLAYILGFPLGSLLKVSIDHLSWTTLSGMPGSWQVERVNMPHPEVPA